MADNQVFLESNLPASIDIEEMIVGRFTAKQLIYLCIGAALLYDCIFKIPNKFIGWTFGALVAAATFFLGFYRMKKYDMSMSDYLIYYFKFKNSQQLFLNKD